ncbi:aldehyde dehydrogenase (NADP(+)) [Chitinophagaceae bacterium LB-8]|uniref:Aldehyde dehydrogenase (NADP(+)) n=1 Tax=Paraflavisolibacter caeni TaxID=2982496 RepID=A0A9X3BHD9_9BACT|nr:aldehyde dehydrogenase (NADP(+)) [Paraflavisolibacter caeni]MCU7552219.1 aldehyde dehydrogenase (NADP(+)) [Paraflavisolibacter caeni]
MVSGKSLIAGNWEEGQGSSFTSFSPLDGSKLNDYRGVNSSQVDRAVNAASEAYLVFKALDFDKRAAFIEDVASEVEALGDELLEVCNQETGLGIPRLTGERARTCGQLRAFASLIREGSWQQASIDTAIPDRKPLPRPDIRSILAPIGPVAVFSASNFPLAFSTLGGDTASALAAGNPVIVKGHPSHPATSELCARAIEKAIEKNNFPKAVFSLLQGADPLVSNELVKHPKIEAVGFTGSTHVGRTLFDQASSRPKPIPVFAEMGSANPLFILANAVKNRTSEIANGLAGSITLGTGQFCTKPGLVFMLTSADTEAFKGKLVAALEQIPDAVLLNANIKTGLQQKLTAYSNKSELLKLTGNTVGGGYLFTVSATDFIKNPELEEEVFGPAALIIECKDMDEMTKAASQLGGHLTGTIHTDNDEEAEKLKSILEEKVGRIIYNGFPTGVEVCPSMHHGGPYPSSTFAAATSVGTAAIKRFCKVVSYQNAPQGHLPEGLKNENPRGIMRLVNGKYSTSKI